MDTNNPVVLAYIAGLFDGEGTAGVYIINRSPSRKYPKGARVISLVAAIKMTDAAPVRFVHSVFGGSFAIIPPKLLQKRKQVYYWTVSYRKAQKFAETILPYIKNPSKVAQLTKILDHYKQWTRPVKGVIRYGSPVYTDAQLAKGWGKWLQ